MNCKLPYCVIALLLTQVTIADEYSGAADCEAYARGVAADRGRVLGGAARGAVKGAALGAIFGDSSKKARRGAKIGAVAGGLRRAGEKDKARKRAYKRCMRDMREREDNKKRENSDD